MNRAFGNKQYGVHITTWRWGLAVYWEWKGNTYGKQWAR